MTRSKGKRSNTRNINTRSYRRHGPEHISSYIQEFKIGDYVDIVINSSVHKGMPYKYYHGKTGKIFNISKSSIGVKIEKIVGNRKIIKKINIRIEHIRKSRSKIEFLDRIKSKDKNRTKLKSTHSLHAFFRQKPCFQINNHWISFKKIKIINPEPFCVIL